MSEGIGVDLGGSKLLVGVVDSEQRVHYQDRATPQGLDEEEILALLERVLRQAREARPDVVGAGLGIPCTIDRDRGVAISAVNLPITDVPIRDLMSERLGLPVFIDNDANLAALAEHRFGAARGTRNAVMITIGTGIGGGLIIGGELYRGSTGAGAELGHVVIDYDGPPCQGACPSYGCAEAVASGTALGRIGREAAEREPQSALGQALAAGRDFDGKLVVDAARSGDAAAREAVTAVGRRIGALLSGLANAFEPEVIVIGGGVAAAGEMLLQPARDELAARALPPMNRVPVVAAELGAESGVMGAAAMAIAEAII